MQGPRTIALRSCLRCGSGDLYRDFVSPEEWRCLQCSHRKYPFAPSRLRSKRTEWEKRKAQSG